MAGPGQRTFRVGAVIGWLLLPMALLGQSAAVEVDRVDFRRVAEDWWQASVQLRPLGDPSSEARAPDFVSEVRLILSLAFRDGPPGEASSFTFYQSSVRMPALERGGPGLVPFYLPGAVVRRDRLPERPFAWVVQLTVAEREVPVARGQFGGEIRTRESYDNFLQQARAGAAAHRGVLRPVYGTPARIVDSGGIDRRKVPAFARAGPAP